jgi:hypothetical protein
MRFNIQEKSMSLESDIYNSPKTDPKAQRMLWDLLDLQFESIIDEKLVFKKTGIDPDAPIFCPLIILKKGEGGDFDGFPNASRLTPGMDNVYTIDFVSLNKLKGLLEHPSIASLYEIGKPAYSLEAIKHHYPKRTPPKPKGLKPF